MKPRRVKRPAPEFKLGHVYGIEYEDHWSSGREYPDEMSVEFRLRTHGVCIRATDRHIVLRHQVHVSDPHPTNKRADLNGILRSAIRSVRHYGPERM